MLCPHCGKLISVNAEKCIHCGKKNTRILTGIPLVNNILSGRVSFVQGIATFNIILFVAALILQPNAIFHAQGGINLLGFLSPSDYILQKLGYTGAIPVIAMGRWWTLMTAIYLHGSLLHIFFNVMWVRQLGHTVEEFYGSSRFFIIYTVSGIAGFIASTLFQIPATLGASGAIFGLFGAIVAYGKNRGGTFGDAVYKQSAQWAAVLFFISFLFPNVDNYAHAGGFIGGYIIATVLGFQEHERETVKHRWLAILCIAATALGFILNLLG